VNSPSNPQAKRHLGQILIDQGILTEDQLRIALLEQTKQHIPVGRLLVQLGFVSEATLRDALSEKLGLQAVDLGRIIVDPSALKLVTRDMARRYRIFPVALDRQQKKFIVALADTNNIVALDQLRAHLKGDFEIELRIAGDSEIERAIEHYYGHEFSIDGILKEIETGEIDYTSVAEGDEYSQPVVRLISALLADSVERGASDIHFEPEQNFLRIRYRIDGVLRQIRSLHKTYWPAMAVRLKVMAKMNIAETRAPQDGRISATMAGRVVDFRVASLPTTHGENLVLRILDRQKGIVPLDKLGLEESQLELLRRMIARPGGHHPRHRPDRQRQDHHPVLDPESHQFRRRQRHDAGGSGRVSDDAHPANLGVGGGQARLRQRYPGHDAPGPRCDPSRRGPRPGDR